MIDGRNLFEIFETITSGTSTPGFAQLPNSNTFLVDTPGAHDSNADAEYPNQTIIYNMIRHARTVKLILAFQFADIDDQRGKNLLAMATLVYRMFKHGSILNDLSKLIIPILSNNS